MALDPTEIAALLAPKAKPKPVVAKVQRERTVFQNGPVRFFDNEMRCSSRGCSSSTYIKMQGIPKCMMHTLIACNELLIAQGFAV
jgi:hypothetical protein